jgi:O-antigen ligase
VLATAPALQASAALVAALAAGVVLAARDPRARAWAMPIALLLAVLALLVVVGDEVSDEISGRKSLVAAAAVAGLVGLVVLSAIFRRWPAAFALCAVAALPARIPLEFGNETANLLLPLYAVIAAGVVVRLRAPEDVLPDPPNPRVLTVMRVIALAIALYALQATYSSDTESAVKDVCFFFVPFAVLLRLLVDLPWSPQLLRDAYRITVGIALLCAVIGIYQWLTKNLFLSNEKVLTANELKPYFRVNSLFFDPNIYGRYLALTMIITAAIMLWARERRTVIRCAIALVILWLGLVPTLSESSFASLALGLAVLAGLRWSFRPVLLTAGVLAVGVVIAAAISPSAIGLDSYKFKDINKATSGRAELVRGGWKMVKDRPLQGYGTGSFPVEYRKREKLRNARASAESHTIPVTIAAEQGFIGLATYLALLFVTLALALHRAGHSRAAAAVAAAYAGLILHTLVYASFLEDPLTWALLALAIAVRRPEAEPAEEDLAVSPVTA